MNRCKITSARRWAQPSAWVPSTTPSISNFGIISGSANTANKAGVQAGSGLNLYNHAGTISGNTGIIVLNDAVITNDATISQ